MIFQKIQLRLVSILFPRTKERRQLALLNRKKRMCMQRYKQSNTFQINESAVRSKAFSAKDAALLRARLFICFGEFLVLLRAQYPSLTEDDLFLCICLVLQLPKNLILFLTITTPNALKMRRYRLRQKLSIEQYNQLFLSI
ncbi:MAG: hypothetical protein LBN06_12505 [Prevotellaceae bacterium]|jgi:hypothetical protein|nr:hypothetical protein [Prevotellaceae bacterium]